MGVGGGEGGGVPVVAMEQIIGEVETNLRGNAEFGWGRGGSKGEAGEKHSDLVLRLLVASVPHPVEEPDGNSFGCDGGLGVESSVGFLMSILLHRILSFGWDQRRWCTRCRKRSMAWP